MPDDNPYQSPQTRSPEGKAGWKRQLIVGILLLVGMLPAAGIAFFCCCLAGFAAAANSGAGADAQISAGIAIYVGIGIGAIAALVVFGAMLRGGIQLIRKSKGATV